MSKGKVKRHREYRRRWRLNASHVKELEAKLQLAENTLHDSFEREKRLRQLLVEMRESLIRAQMTLTDYAIDGEDGRPVDTRPSGTYAVSIYDSLMWLHGVARLSLAPEIWNPMEVK